MNAMPHMEEICRRVVAAYRKAYGSGSDTEAIYFRDSINRSYYAIFTTVRALLAERGIEFKKHSAVISYFRCEYTKTGIFEVKYSDYIGSAFEFRNDCDYGDFVFASREEAQEQYVHAVEFVKVVKNYLEGENVCEDTGDKHISAADD